MPLSKLVARSNGTETEGTAEGSEPGRIVREGCVADSKLRVQIGLEHVGEAPGALVRATFTLMMHNNVISEIADASKKLLARKGYEAFKKAVVVLPMVVPSSCDRENYVDDMISIAGEALHAPWHGSTEAVGANPLIYARIVVEPSMILGRASIGSPNARPKWLPKVQSRNDNEDEKMNETSETAHKDEERYEGVEMGEFGENPEILRELVMKHPTAFVGQQATVDIPMP
eukprot:scaffold391_cov223-Pinguiococcus_pyrenoidosus.AAC.10